MRLGFVIAVLGMAGISYWVVQERSQSTALTKNVAEAPAPAMQKPAQNPLPASESPAPDAGASPAAVVETVSHRPNRPRVKKSPWINQRLRRPLKRQTSRKVPLQTWLQRLQQANPKSQLRHRSRLRGVRNQPKRQHLLRRRPVLWRQPYPQKTK